MSRLRPDLTYIVNETVERIQTGTDSREEWYGLLVYYAEQYSNTEKSLEEQVLSEFTEAYSMFREKDLPKNKAVYFAVSSVANKYNPTEERFVDI